jgi:hypothetical protein
MLAMFTRRFLSIPLRPIERIITKICERAHGRFAFHLDPQTESYARRQGKPTLRKRDAGEAHREV